MEATIDNVPAAKPLTAEDREQVIADRLRGASSAKLAWLKAASRKDITGQVGAIEVPNTVVAGELDRIDTPDLLRPELLSRAASAHACAVSNGDLLSRPMRWLRSWSSFALHSRLLGVLAEA